MYEVIKIIDSEKWVHGRYPTEEKAINAAECVSRDYRVPVLIKEVKQDVVH